MHFVGGPSWNLRRPRVRLALPWVVMQVTTSSTVWAAEPGADATAASPFAAPWALTLAIAALALVIGAWLAFRAARTQRGLAAELRDARARSQCLEPLLDLWVWESDREHRIVSMRPPPGAPMSDWSPAQGAPLLWERFSVDDEAAFRAKLQSGVPLDDTPVRCKDAEGRVTHAAMRARMRTDEQGRFAGYFGIVRDLAEPVVSLPVARTPAAAHRVAAAPSMLEEHADTAATDHDAFSFTVSHDLRAPIRVVEGFTKIVKEDYGRLLDRVGNDHLDRVLGAAARMNNMIDALLALSKLSSQPLARQPVNLSQLAGYVADDLRRQWPERSVAVEIEPGMQVQGDPTLLRVVLENLLGNAWKYTGKAAEPGVAFTRDPNRADSFRVRDNGAGFDMRFADRLFGVFQRLHSANDFPGTGVGLASVRRIVRRHGGDIWGEAEVNRGATFYFSLPQRAEPH
jgi:signal transduction histidine kinase